MASFEIPESYSDALEVVEVGDTRTDEEILASLNQYVPVASEKNIWTFWHDGVLNMPAWCQRNVADWVRICGPEWTVRVLDNVPGSPNFALRYLSPANLPDCFVDRTMDGPYVGQHSADFVRGAAILEHGGVWMDTGSIMVMHVDRMCWDRLADPSSPYEVAAMLRGDQWIFNCFLAARRGNPFLRRVNELFLHLWKGRTNHRGVTHSPLFRYLARLFPANNDNNDDDNNNNSEAQARPPAEAPQQQKPSGRLDFLDWKVSMQELLDYGAQMVAWHRVALLEDPSDGFSGPDYWARHVLLLDFAPEMAMPTALLGVAKSGGARMLELLSMQRRDVRRGTEEDEDQQQQQQQEEEENDAAEHREAARVVWETLARSSFWKISHAKGLTHRPQLGTLLDAPENAGRDRAPGTYMELLRHGTVHFRQTRPGPALRDPPRPPFTLRTRLLEPEPAPEPEPETEAGLAVPAE
ncbi:hypothetical protein VTH06DRAFT_301 [Thermothelomyces fergusii]